MKYNTTMTECHLYTALSNNYEDERAYYNEILAAAHEKAFALSYTSGRRPWRSSFDRDLYFAELFKALRERAQADGKSTVHDALMKLQEQQRRP